MMASKARPTRDWIEYFLQNRSHLLPIPWELGAELDEEERAAITSSIQAFQLGESSEGRNLIRYARAWAARSGDADYVEAIGMLIAEEQRHARELGRFMELNHIPCIRRRWTDSVFRRLRNFIGTLEISIGVLVTAEMIAKVYYVALREASQSTILSRICDQILLDEARHVEFQTEQLARLQLGRAAPLLSATLALHQLLFAGATLVVAWSHRATLSRGGFGFRRFWRACVSEFASSVLNPLLPVKAINPTLAGRTTIPDACARVTAPAAPSASAANRCAIVPRRPRSHASERSLAHGRFEPEL